MRMTWMCLTVWVAGCVGTSGSGGNADAGGAISDAAVPRDAGDDTGDAGCLSFGAASAACGFNSDGTVCLMAVGCGQSLSDNACRVNCENGTRTHCYSQNDVTCMQRAVVSQVCGELLACGFAL